MIKNIYLYTKQQIGLSLIEMIIAMAIVSVLGLMLASILVNTTGVFHEQSAVINQGVNLNDILSKIKSNIKVSQNVAIGYPEVAPEFTSSSSQLVLKLPAIDTSSNIINNVFDYFVYQVNQSKLSEKIFPNPQSARITLDLVILTNVDKIVFEYFNELNEVVAPENAKKVRVTLTIKQKAGILDKMSIATAEAYLKNN